MFSIDDCLRLLWLSDRFDRVLRGFRLNCVSFFRDILSHSRCANSVLLFSEIVVGLRDFSLEPYLIIFDLG